MCLRNPSMVAVPVASLQARPTAGFTCVQFFRAVYGIAFCVEPPIPYECWSFTQFTGMGGPTQNANMYAFGDYT